MAKKKSKTKGPSRSSGPAPATVPSGERKMIAIVAAVIGAFALVAWMGSREDTAHAPAPRSDAGSHEHHAPPPLDTGPIDPRLLHPEQLTERAPDTFAAEVRTTAGTFVIDVHRAWSPNGADRFYNLVRAGYYGNVAFFRVIEGFMAQCGIHGRPEVSRAWHDANIADDPVVEHNTRGMVSFATAGPNTRTTQFFINFADNSRLDGMGFSPFGRVRDMAVVDRLDGRYGEGAPGGRGPSQERMEREGNTYLRASYPGLDYIESVRVM
jgi:peptidyl-prolyl cis-trans isomerase A (cyclophilin A)